MAGCTRQTMPRICSVCTHKDRAGIDSALLASKPYRTVARRYGASDSAVFRHKAEHLPSSLLKAQKVEEVARADTLLGQVRDYQDRVDTITTKAENAGDYRTALGGLREARGYLELLAKLVGDLDESPTINIVQDPTFVQFNALVVDALQPYPEARRAVLTALRGVQDA